MKFHYLLVFLGIVAFQSCTNYARLVTLKPFTPGIDSTKLLYTNDSFSIQYDFYGKGCFMKMTIHNYFNKPLLVDWGQSSYIIGNNTYTYWVNSTTVTVDHHTTSVEIDQPGEFANIPPGTSVQKEIEITIPVSFVKLPMKRTYKQKKMTPESNNDSFGISETDYTLPNSPFVFRNYLSLSYGGSTSSRFFLDHQFWVSSVRDMKMKDFLGSYIDVSSGNTIYTYPFKNTNCFYVVYDPNDQDY